MERISSFFFTFFLFGKLVWMWIILCRQIAETQAKKELDKPITILYNVHVASRENGRLAQLARASAWRAEGHRFESYIVHQKCHPLWMAFFLWRSRVSYWTPIRVYLKTGNMTNGEGFFAWWSHFFAGILCVLQEKNGAQQVEKTRCLGVLTVFR